MIEGTPILVVDDEPAIRRLLRTSLGPQGFRVIEAASGKDALDRLRLDRPDLLLLDLGLPDLDGAEVIRRLRNTGNRIPIVILSSRGDERGKVEAFELGADDYVTKPFGMAELVARIRAALRHRFAEQGGEPAFESGSLRVDLVRRLVSVRGAEVKLSPKEYEILRQLVLHAGRVLTHRYLLEQVWGKDVDVQYLRIYVRQLRQKIEDNPAQPQHVLTETSIGYRLQVDG